VKTFFTQIYGIEEHFYDQYEALFFLLLKPSADLAKYKIKTDPLVVPMLLLFRDKPNKENIVKCFGHPVFKAIYFGDVNSPCGNLTPFKLSVEMQNLRNSLSP